MAVGGGLKSCEETSEKVVLFLLSAFVESDCWDWYTPLSDVGGGVSS